MKNNVGKKIIRLIRFCKEYELYDIIKYNFKSIDELECKLSYYPIASYISIILRIAPNEIFIKKNILNSIVENDWKQFVKDLIEDEEKRKKINEEFSKKINEEMIKALQSINNSYFAFPHSYIPSYLQEDNYGDDSYYGGLVDYFNFLKNI